MSLESRNRAAFRSAQRRYDNMLPPDEPENPECRECGAVMEGHGDKWEWNFDCPRCGWNLSGDRYEDR